MAEVKVLVLTGYGINCDYETEHTFNLAGAKAERIHINDLIDNKVSLENYHILAIPGGFSYADDLGAGKVLANKIKYHLKPQLEKFISDRKLIIGICNGFQVLIKLGILPGLNHLNQEASLISNDSGRFEDRWVNLKINESKCIWTKNLQKISLPVRHGEGKFYSSEEIIKKLFQNNQVVLQYTDDSGNETQEYPKNPNGSLRSIAGICDSTGRIFGLMPHPEGFNNFTNHFYWTRQEIKFKKEEGYGIEIFRNAVEFVKENLLGKNEKDSLINSTIKYSDFVDYSKLDPIKKAALEKFSGTLNEPERLRIKVVAETIGEPAIALDFLDYDFMLAFNVEGLGTKNIIADIMSKDSRGKGLAYYENIGQDVVAMSSNDLLSIGADIFVYGDILSSGSSEWFNDKNSMALLEGFRKAAQELKIAIPCGETPTLKDVVYPETLDMAGASIGIIKPKSRLIYGKDLEEGDRIFGLSSSGLHSNGITLVRKIVENFSESYFTKLPSGKIIGEEILIPTRLYSRPIVEMIDSGIKIKYLAPITGHGWKKIARAKKQFDYIIDKLPEIPEIFKFLQEKGNINDNEAFQTFNMGIGMVLIAPENEESKIRDICTKHQIDFFNLGYLKKSQDNKKRVFIQEKDLIYEI